MPPPLSFTEQTEEPLDVIPALAGWVRGALVGIVLGLVAVFAADGTKVFTGETFNGPASRTYELPSLTAGSYRFQCDVHPDMKGTLTAG